MGTPVPTRHSLPPLHARALGGRIMADSFSLAGAEVCRALREDAVDVTNQESCRSSRSSLNRCSSASLRCFTPSQHGCSSTRIIVGLPTTPGSRSGFLSGHLRLCWCSPSRYVADVVAFRLGSLMTIAAPRDKPRACLSRFRCQPAYGGWCRSILFTFQRSYIRRKQVVIRRPDRRRRCVLGTSRFAALNGVGTDDRPHIRSRRIAYTLSGDTTYG